MKKSQAGTAYIRIYSAWHIVSLFKRAYEQFVCHLKCMACALLTRALVR